MKLYIDSYYPEHPGYGNHPKFRNAQRELLARRMFRGIEQWETWFVDCQTPKDYEMFIEDMWATGYSIAEIGTWQFVDDELRFFVRNYLE